jgi:hypothetical protein
MFILAGCATPVEQDRPRRMTTLAPELPAAPHHHRITWFGQIDQRYRVEWTPWLYAQWVDVSGWLHFVSTNMEWQMANEGGYRVLTECWP